MDLRDAHVVVTGGSSGIGLATVRRFLDAGSKVSVIALDDADLRTLAANPPGGRHPLHLEPADVADRPLLEAAIGRAVAANGPCHVLVTSAGIVMPGYFEQLDIGHFEREMQVNYFGTLYAIRAVVPVMIARRRGAIIAISSSAGLLGVFGYSAYGPTKYAVRGLCDVVRNELKPHGIHVACVFPSDVDTPQLAFEDPFKPDELRAVSGKVRPVSPERVAATILRGLRRRSAVIYPETKTRLIARISSVAPGITRRYLDGVVRRARKKRLEGP